MRYEEIGISIVQCYNAIDLLMTVVWFQREYIIYANINKRYCSAIFLLSYVYIIHMVDLSENA